MEDAFDKTKQGVLPLGLRAGFRVYTHVCVHIYIYIYVYIYICICSFIYLFSIVYLTTCLHRRIHACYSFCKLKSEQEEVIGTCAPISNSVGLMLCMSLHGSYEV